MPVTQSPTDVVSPLNWFLELKSIVFVPITAQPLIAAEPKSDTLTPLTSVR